MSFLVHIADTDAASAAAAAYLLERRGHPVQTYAGPAEFLRAAPHAPGCLLLDVGPEARSGQEVQEALARRGAALPIVAIGGRGDVRAAVRAIGFGAVDFLERPVDSAALAAAVETAGAALAAGDERESARTAAAVRLERLSRRERQMLQGLLGGLSNKAIARRLGLSPRTVEMHRASMMEDLGVSSLPEAIRLGLDAGLPPLGEAGEETGVQPPLSARAEDRGRRYEEKLRLVLEASGDGSWEWSIPTSEMRVSERLVRRLGYRAGEAPDRFERMQDFIHPRDWDRVRAELDAHLEGRSESFACEFRVRTAERSWAWLFVVGSIVDRGAGGAPLRMVGSVSDISGRKEEERRAREAAELLELALWGADAGVWEFDLDTRALRLCPRSRALHGLPEEGPELISEAEWVQTVHPDDRAGAMAAADRAIATGEPFRCEYRAAIGPGRFRRLIGLGKVIFDGEGRPWRIVGLHQEAAGRAPGQLGLASTAREAEPAER